MKIDEETFSFTIGGIAAAITAIGIVTYMVSGGYSLPEGRTPGLVLVAIFVVPPLFGGAAAFFAGTFGIGRPIYLLMTRKARAARKMQFAAEAEAEKQRKIERERARERRKADEDVVRQKRAAEQAAARGEARREEAVALEKVRSAIAYGDVAAFENALSQHPPEFVSMLLAPDPASGTTAGHTAARNGHAAMLESIARNGLSELYRDRDGQTMLDVGPADRRDDLEFAYCRGHAKHVAKEWQLGFDNEQADLLNRFFVERAKLRHHDTKALYTLDGSRSQIAEYFSNAAAEAEQRGEYKRARSIATGGGRTLPSAIDPYIRKASANLHLKNYAGVIDDTNAALKLDPASYWAYRFRGIARAALGRKEEAVADLAQSLAINPDQADLQERLNELIMS